MAIMRSKRDAQDRPKRSSNRRFVRGVAASLVVACSALAAVRSPVAPRAAEGEGETIEQIRENNEKRYANGGMVVTRPEFDDLLRRAEMFAADGGFRNATILWNKVLDEGGSALHSNDGETYTPLSEQVERAIAGLPPEGRQAYRIVADGEAQALLAQSERLGRQTALAQVVERYFLSSVGDQAAFELAGLRLDRNDPVGAIRLLDRIVDRHPDPDVPAAELSLRRAVAFSMLGRADEAREAFRASLSAGAAVAPELLEAVDRMIQQGPGSSASTRTAIPWGQPFGNPRRDGLMPALPDDYLAGDLMVTASLETDRSVDRSQLDAAMRNFGGMTQEATGDQYGPALLRAAQFGWLPTQEGLIAPDGILVRSATSPLAVRANDQGEISKVWESLWSNHWVLDDASLAERMNLAMYGATQGARGGPSSLTEIFLFGDRIHQSMTIVGDQVIVVEGQPYPRGGKRPDAAALARNAGGFGIQALRRSRTSWLTAYDLRTGKLRWTRAAIDPDFVAGSGAIVPNPGVGLVVPDLAPPVAPAAPFEGPVQVEQAAAPDQVTPVTGEPAAPEAPRDNREGIGPDGLPIAAGRDGPPMVSNSVGYLGEGVAVGELMILPLSDGGSVHLQAVSLSDGKTVWRTQLCDAPSAGSPKWAPVRLAVDGQDLYCCCGVGLVFAVNAADGRIRFARRYDRSVIGGTDNTAANNWGGQMPTTAQFDGWLEDLVIPFRSVIVVAPSDSDRLIAFDRTDGRFVWSAPKNPFADPMQYVIGVRGRQLFAAGKESILCYDLQGQGRLVWREEFGGESLGRGCLTESGIYMPTSNSVIRYAYDLPAGQRTRKLAQVGVRGLGSVPVGNLLSDGRRLWSIGPGVVQALDSARNRIDDLERRSEAGEASAIWERILLTIETGDSSRALQLLDALVEATSPDEPRHAATRARIRSLDWLETLSETGSASTVSGILMRLGELDGGRGEWIDWQASRVQWSRLASLFRDDQEFRNERRAVAWAPLVASLDDPSTRRELIDALAPERYGAVGQRDVAVRMFGRSHPGCLLMGLAWLDDAGAEQTRPYLERLAVDPELAESIRSGAIARLLLVRAETSIDAVERALLEFRSPYWTRQVIVDWERATGQPLAIDPFAPLEARAEQVAAWRAGANAAAAPISWRRFDLSVRGRFDRLIAGFPNTGELVELSSDGRVLREWAADGLIAATAIATGEVWIAYPDRVERRDVHGAPVTSIELGGYPKGIASNGADEVWVALDGVPGSILVLRDGGVSVDRIETSGEAIDAICPWDDDTFLVAARVSGLLQRWHRTEGHEADLVGAMNVSGIHRTDEGHLLTVSSLNGVVQEFGAEGNLVARRSNLPQARAGVRTEAGLTVVACSRGVVAVDRDGQEVWSVADRGPAITLSYY